MIERRSVIVGGDLIVATPLPHGTEMVRFHPNGDPKYNRMIAAFMEPDGRTIHLMGWIAKDGFEVGLEDWIAAQRGLFPAATRVRFERLEDDGTLREVLLPLRRAA